MERRRKIKRLLDLDIIKTLYFNFRCLPLKAAVRFPVFVFRKTRLSQLNGRFELKCAPVTGMIQIGPGMLGTVDRKYTRTVWGVSGHIVFEGKAAFGRGSRIAVAENAELVLGDNVTVTGDSTIICEKGIRIGAGSLLSWEVLMMDTDYHSIYKLGDPDTVINPPKPIVIGENVWIGCRSTVLKGTTVLDNTVIAACSMVTKSILTDHCVIGGQDAQRILKTDIVWKR